MEKNERHNKFILFLMKTKRKKEFARDKSFSFYVSFRISFKMKRMTVVSTRKRRNMSHSTIYDFFYYADKIANEPGFKIKWRICQLSPLRNTHEAI